ncbi:MAG: hypothetical protein WCB27_05060 [Thermoguttaceae bacterium]
MTIYPTEISVTAPVGQALDRVKRMLFQPFDLGKWFVIGFCAWLAGLGESGGGGGGNFYSGGGGQPGGPHSFRDFTDKAGHFVVQNLYWIVPAAMVLLVVGLVWGLLLTWLSSRGKFMFLHCVALNQAEVKRPWREFAREANSLFWFRFVLGMIGLFCFLPLLGGVFFIVGRMLYRGSAEPGGIVLALVLGLAFFALALCLGLVHKFTMDFVVPIMSLRRTGCTAAWREFLVMLADNAGRFTLYVLFQIVLGMAIGVLVLLVVVVTCCIAGCLMALPYVGTVLLLPVLVFERSYSIYYLAQFGPAYDVFPPAQPV